MGRSSLTVAVAVLTVTILPAGLPLSLSTTADAATSSSTAWTLSKGTLPVGRYGVLGVKLDDDRSLWVGGTADNPVDQNRVFLYDIRTTTFTEVAPVPAAKPVNGLAGVGVLADGSVVITGGALVSPDSGTSVLSYRYFPALNRWVRTGDLPEPQDWLANPMTRLPGGRLIIAGGRGEETLPAGVGSLNAFVFDPGALTTVKVIDPATGTPTGKTAVVLGKWDYTRTRTGAVSKLSSPHIFGNQTLLRDGRLFVAGGHTRWKFTDANATSELAIATDYYDPASGAWAAGAPLPTVAGEDDRIPGSYGGRTNGYCLSVLEDGQVVIAGGNSATDGASYFDTALGRQSILVMNPARDPRASTYRLSPNPIPSGHDFGGFFGDGGRNQLLCYGLPGNRILIAGGQDIAGDDLYDTYFFDETGFRVTRGPDLVHGLALWASANPDFGFPPGYESATISAQAVSERNSQLVFNGTTLVHGGGYDGNSNDTIYNLHAEQVTLRPGG